MNGGSRNNLSCNGTIYNVSSVYDNNGSSMTMWTREWVAPWRSRWVNVASGSTTSPRSLGPRAHTSTRWYELTQGRWSIQETIQLKMHTIEHLLEAYSRCWQWRSCTQSIASHAAHGLPHLLTPQYYSAKLYLWVNPYITNLNVDKPASAERSVRGHHAVEVECRLLKMKGILREIITKSGVRWGEQTQHSAYLQQFLSIYKIIQQ